MQPRRQPSEELGGGTVAHRSVEVAEVLLDLLTKEATTDKGVQPCLRRDDVLGTFSGHGHRQKKISFLIQPNTEIRAPNLRETDRETYGNYERRHSTWTSK